MNVDDQNTSIADNLFLDWDAPLTIFHGDKLPHWHQDGKTQFVTFRLADSLPQDKVAEIKGLISNFEILHPKPWDKNTVSEYNKLVGPILERNLDNGYGECVLGDEAVRGIVEEAITRCDGDTYEVLAYVIMPNHVHILVNMSAERTLGMFIKYIKGSTSHKINQLLNRQGALWMRRYFDRIVRSEDHLKHYIHYIYNNPRHLPPSSYTLYIKH